MAARSSPAASSLPLADARPALTVSMCTFGNGEFDLILIDPLTSEEITITGSRIFTAKQLAFFERLMPACVWTTYERKEPRA